MEYMRQLKISKSITNIDTESLDKYLKEISQYPLLSADEEVILAQRIRQWDPIALEKLIQCNLRFVVSVAKQYQNQWLALMDLIQNGNVWLAKAAKRYDETRGFKFISYAVRWIRQSILAWLAEQARIVRLPLNQISTIKKIQKATNAFIQQEMRDPRIDELSERLDMSEESIEMALAIQARTISVNAPVNNEDDTETLLELMESDEAHADHALQYTDSLKKEIARTLNIIDEREADVLTKYFWLNGKEPMKLEEIAEDFDLSRERVRQIKEKAIKKLKPHIGRDVNDKPTANRKSKNLQQYLCK